MGKKRRLSLSFRSFAGKCKALDCARNAGRWRPTVLGCFMMRGRQKISIAAVTVVLFAACGFPQSNTTAPDQTERRIDSILSQMTIEEKIDLLGGVDDFYLRGVPRLGVPRFKMADGPLGVRNYGPATTMAGGIGLAATWNPALAEQARTEIGRDARSKRVHFLLVPGVNIHRAPMNRRDFDYFLEDPFLTS